MPSGEDDEIAARCGPLLGFDDVLTGVRLLLGLLVELLASERFLGDLLTGERLAAGRTFLE